MELLFLLTGVAVGLGVMWLIRRSGQNPQQAALIEKLNADLIELNRSSSRNERTNELLLQEKAALQGQYERANEQAFKLNAELSKVTSEYSALEARLLEQKDEMNKLREQFKLEFENMANRIFEEKSKKFTDQNRTNLDQILQPFNEKIKDFEKKVGEAYDKELRDKTSLREEVRKLVELNTRISQEANNLTKALKGDVKKQGNWGELILERVLERSGLVRDREYRTQVVTRNNEGDSIKPDVVVYLPDNKHLIIDSKVSLLAYDQYVNEEQEEQRNAYLKEHLNSVRTHIKTLGDKNYYAASDLSTPDFVLLFMPIESAFSLAIQEDSDLFAFGWDKRVVLVSPTTLLATLRTVASLWKIENHNRNAQQIAEEAGKLYDKFEGLMRDLIEVGKKMDQSKGAYEDAMKKVVSGPGNLIGKVEKLKTLGAKTTKALPPNLIDRSAED